MVDEGAFEDLGAEKPDVEPPAKGDVSLEQGVKGGGEDGGEVGEEEEGLVEGEEDGDHVQGCTLDQYVPVHQSCTHS